jgi:hypothetical protein
LGGGVVTKPYPVEPNYETKLANLEKVLNVVVEGHKYDINQIPNKFDNIIEGQTQTITA